jgi:hypothetical protein
MAWGANPRKNIPSTIIGRQAKPQKKNLSCFMKQADEGTCQMARQAKTQKKSPFPVFREGVGVGSI